MIPARQPKNVGASVRARLLDLSRRWNTEFQQVLSEFAIERLLYRLGVTNSRMKDFYDVYFPASSFAFDG